MSTGRFNPCAGNNACTEEGTRCGGCGRTLEEVARTRAAVDAMVALALEMDYGNVDEFAAYVARRITIKTARERQRAAGTLPERIAHTPPDAMLETATE